MISPDSSQTDLESLIDKVLCDQPPIRAPEELSVRVFAAIERREMRLRQRKDFRSWPLAARIAFCIVSFGVIAFVIAGSSWLFGVLGSSVPLSVSRELALWQAAVTIGTSLVHSVPAYWFYAAVGAVAAVYVAFFGIGAAAYRTLYEQQPRQS
jgi:hypothetical protein